MNRFLCAFLCSFAIGLSSCINGITDKAASPLSNLDSANTNTEPVSDSLSFEGAGVKSDDYYDNFPPYQSILGCWSAIREGDISINFESDTSFVFYDYNSKTEQKEELKGKFKIKDDVLTLIYDDRPKQNFIFRKDTSEVPKYYIEGSEGYYFRRCD